MSTIGIGFGFVFFFLCRFLVFFFVKWVGGEFVIVFVGFCCVFLF